VSDKQEIDQQNLLALGDDEPILDAWDAAVEQSLPYRYTITSYGTDYPVDGLVKRMNPNPYSSRSL
jgi:hypothetical protein